MIHCWDITWLVLVSGVSILLWWFNFVPTSQQLLWWHHNGRDRQNYKNITLFTYNAPKISAIHEFLRVYWKWYFNFSFFSHIFPPSVGCECVLFLMKCCDHIINSQCKMTWSQRSIYTGLTVMSSGSTRSRAPSGLWGRCDNLVSHSHHLGWHIHTHTHTQSTIWHTGEAFWSLHKVCMFIGLFSFSHFISACWHTTVAPTTEPMDLLSPNNIL